MISLPLRMYANTYPSNTGADNTLLVTRPRLAAFPGGTSLVKTDRPNLFGPRCPMLAPNDGLDPARTSRHGQKHAPKRETWTKIEISEPKNGGTAEFGWSDGATR